MAAAPRSSVFFTRVARSRQRLLDRTYKRDKDGKFASGGGGVRDSLARATTIGELNAATAAEAKRITGRDTHVDMAGADLEVAKELNEGVLRGMEHTPSTRLDSIETYGRGGARKARDDEDGGEYANARGAVDDGGETPTYQLGFSTTWVGNPTKLRESMADDAKTQAGGGPGSVGGKHGPMSIGVHEFGHVASSQVPSTHERVTYHVSGRELDRYKVDVEFEAQDRVHAIVEERTGSPYGNNQENPRSVIGREVSSYASWERGELTAEAFADVVLNGDKASSLSHDIYDMVTRGAGPTNRMPTFLLRPPSILGRTYKRDSKGRFGSGGGDGVRETLAEASTIEEINAAASTEAKRITGRDIPFDMTGSDPQIAREHCEGVLQGLERFPRTP